MTELQWYVTKQFMRLVMLAFSLLIKNNANISVEDKLTYYAMGEGVRQDMSHPE